MIEGIFDAERVVLKPLSVVETWMIEGRQGDRCHASDYWCPPDGRYLDLGRLFLDLAEL